VLILNSVKCKIAFLSVIIIFSALPFLNQAVHIDDTLFVQTARNIINNPLDPYGSSVNWFGDSEKLFDFFSNPPLSSYYLAGIMQIWGESEFAMHLACVPFALMAGLGMYFLAVRFGSPPFVSALLLVFSPVFFTMSHTLMPDAAMSAFVISAVWLFIRGYDENSKSSAIAGGILAGVAPLLRYNGLVASLAIAFYILCNFRKDKIKYGAVLLIPALLFAAWNLFTLKYYGAMHFIHHYHFQNDTSGGMDNVMIRTLSNIVYIASCFVLLFLVVLWKKRSAFVALLSFFLAFLLAFAIQRLTHYAFINLCLVLIIALGASSFLIIAIKDLAEQWQSGFPRDLVFLLLWLAGILWMHKSGSHSAAKYMIVALPPVIIIALRSAGQFMGRKLMAATVAFTVLTGIVTATADYRLAGVYRNMAKDAVEQTDPFHCPKYFTGHWGFQYYMERASATAYPQMKRVDAPAVLSSVSASYPQKIHPGMETDMIMIFQKKYYDHFPFCTLSEIPGFQANFYTHFYGIPGNDPANVIYGVLPFSFSPSPLVEMLTIYKLK
jgi:4-amino-4-deoxy-L-arabinose transferase-like glycosyltransferase